MQWNNTATDQGIFQDIDFLCATNSSTFSIADKTRSINNWQGTMLIEILDSMDDWDFSGEIATGTLSANYQEYPLPTANNSALLKIKRVEIDYDGDGKYTPARKIDISEYPNITLATSAEINNRFIEDDPKYSLFDHSLFLFPVPDTDRTSGLKIWYVENITDFTATAANNTAEPVFPRPFHRILSLGSSLDYAKKYKMEDLIKYCERELYGTANTRKGRQGGLISKMRDFFSTRSVDKKARVKTGYYKENYR